MTNRPPRPHGFHAWLQVVRCYQKASRRLSDRLAPLALTNAQFDVLANLLAGPEHGLTQDQLGQRLLVTKGNVSGLLDRLGERGLITRRPNPEDGRSKLVQLTATGVGLAEQAVQVQRNFIAALMQPLTETDLERLCRILEQVEERLDEQADSERP
jgi:DNA-binding MarR family transcriptional regulator